MTLFIEKTSDYDSAFIEWLLRYIKALMNRLINPQKLLVIDELLHTVQYKHLLPSTLNLYQVLMIGIDSLRIRETERFYIIYMPLLVMVGKEKIRVRTLCKFINYGCCVIKGYPIFSKTFEYIKNNLKKLHKVYLADISLGDFE